MKRLCLTLMSCAFLFAFFVINVEANDILKPKDTSVKNPSATKPLKAKPVEKPKSTSKRDQVSATGYHDKEEGEETQELKPNVLDKKATGAINPRHDPIKNTR
ncbi:MAG: hypothetical protein JXR79_04465 [Nitrospirae bacterium]|nr:hypothetical protein [Nitrospirota bacterium]